MLRLCLGLLRAFRRLVPPRAREDWEREWQGEVVHLWSRLATRRQLTWRNQMDLVRRILGALPDAAWMRRQLTTDAELVHDLRHGAHLLLRKPGSAVAAVLILSLGLGAGTAIFTVADHLLLRPLPYREAERVVTLWQSDSREGVEKGDVAPGNFVSWRERSRTLQGMAAAVPWSFDYTEGPEPESLFAVLVTEGFFEVVGVEAALGRTLRPEDHLPGAAPVVLLTHGLWQRLSGGDPGLVGSTLTLDGEPATVVGVLPADFALGLLPTSGERGVWAPKAIADWEREHRGGAWWSAVGRLGPGVTVEEAQAEMDAIAASLAREYPVTNEGVGVTVVSLGDHLVGGVKPALQLLLGAVALLLLITWANVANLMLARGAERRRELAVRASLGAGRLRLVRQLLAEGSVLAALGAGLGLALAAGGVRFIAALSPVDVPRMGEVALDGRTAAFAAALALLTTLAFGIVPALRLSRSSPVRAMGAGGQSPVADGRSRLRRALAVGEVALAVLLLAAAGLLLRSFTGLLRVDPGFREDNVLALQLFLSERQESPEARALFFSDTLERVASLPGVQEAGAVSMMPFIEAAIDVRAPMRVADRPAPEPGQETNALRTVATAGYFRAMRIPLIRGRLFEESDRAGTRAVALVNEVFARRLFAGEDPVGREIVIGTGEQAGRVEVVGVVGAVRHSRLEEPPAPELFVPHAQVPFGSMTYVVRAQGDPGAALAAVKARIWEVDPLQTFYRTATLPELVGKSVADRRFVLVLLAIFAGMAVLVSLVGVYALLSFLTAQRRQELGVRLALGARGGQVLRLVLSQGLGMILLGVALGLAGALACGRLLSRYLWGVSAADPTTLAAVSALLVAVALVACYLPARRAARTDPVVVLKEE